MKQFAVIGLGRFGSSVAKTLSEKGCQVLAIDIKEDVVQDMSEFVTQAVCVDATDEKAFRSLGIGDVDCAIVGIGANMEKSILVTLLLKEFGVKDIVVKSISSLHAKIVAKVGADRVIYPEREIAKKLAEGLLSPNIIDEIKLSNEYNIVEMVSPSKYEQEIKKKMNKANRKCFFNDFIKSSQSL